MTKDYHLLWWMFHYLSMRCPDVLNTMLEEFSDERWNNKATMTRRQSLTERYAAYQKSLVKDRGK